MGGRRRRRRRGVSLFSPLAEGLDKRERSVSGRCSCCCSPAAPAGQLPAAYFSRRVGRGPFPSGHALIACGRAKVSRVKATQRFSDFSRRETGRRREEERESAVVRTTEATWRGTNGVYRVHRTFAMSGRLFFYGFSFYALFNRRRAGARLHTGGAISLRRR